MRNDQMPDGSDEECDDVIFLSPDESPQKEENSQGASPQLRRSNRKRKSVTTVRDMSKGVGSSSKKKKNSPKTKQNSPKDSSNKNMPKVPRTSPKGTADNNKQDTHSDKNKSGNGPENFAELLMAMEARLSSKLDANKKAVNEAITLSKLNSDALDALEEKVDNSDEILKETLARVEAQEERVLARVETQVEEMVKAQLRAAGFDSQLSAGDLSVVNRSKEGSYAAVTADRTKMSTQSVTYMDKDQRQERKFWESRRSLRLWPVTEPTEAGLKKFLKEKLAMDDTFLDEDMGQVVVKRNIEKKPKNKDEVCVIFESKEIRDVVKSQGPNLANYRDEAGMRLQIPDNLQKDFKALMSVAYDLKQKNKDLKRNVKFDEESLGLYMDIQMERDGDWRRVKPQQAFKALANRTQKNGPRSMDEEEIASLLGGDNE